MEYIFHMSRHGNFCLEKVCVGSITNRNAIPYKRIYMFYLYKNSVGWGGRLRPHEIIITNAENSELKKRITRSSLSPVGHNRAHTFLFIKLIHQIKPIIMFGPL